MEQVNQQSPRRCRYSIIYAISSRSITQRLQHSKCSSVAALKDKSAAALLGFKVNHSLTDKATLTAQLGLEQDFYHSVSNYSATSLNADILNPVAFNTDIKRTRPVASAGAYYDLTKAQRLSATINYQQLPFQSTSAVTGYFTLKKGVLAYSGGAKLAGVK